MERTVDLSFFNAKISLLKGVDTSRQFPCGTWREEQANSLVFKLDGKIYAAVEDPSDGYRSCLSRVLILPRNTILSTPLPDIKVFSRHLTGDSDEIVEFIDMKNGKTVMRIGTRNTDDYYPHFVGEFHPTALSANTDPA